MFETILDNCTANTRLLKKLVADIPAEKMCVQFPNVPNHAAWQVGHLTNVRAMLSGMMGKPAGLPADWVARFGRNSVPVADASVYPSKESLLALFEKTHEHLVTVLRSLDLSALNGPHDREALLPLFPTKRHLLINMLTTHDGMHLGQLGDFRRALGLPRVL